MATVADQLVGRAEEIGVVERAVTGLGDGGAGGDRCSSVSPGSARPACWPSWRSRADGAGCIVLSGSGSEFEQDLPFWVFVDALDEYVAGLDPRRLESLEDGVRGELAGSAPLAVRVRRRQPSAAPGPALPRPSRGSASCSSDWPRRSRSSSCSTTSTGPTPPRSTCSARCCAARPPPPCCSRSGARPRQMPERLTGALERADRAGALTPARARRARARRGRAAARRGTMDGVLAGRALPAERRQPVLPGGAGAIAGARRTARRRPVADLALTRRGRAASGGRRAHRGARRCWRSPSRRLFEGAAVAGDPFEPELAAAAAAIDDAAAARGARRPALTRPRPANRRAAALPLPPSARANGRLRDGARRLGLGARTSAARTRWPSAAPRRRRARTTWSTPRARRHRGARRCCARPAATVDAQRARERRALVRRRASPASGRRSARGAARAAHGARRGAGGKRTAGARAAPTLLETLALVPEDAVATWVQLTVACADVEHFLGRHDLAQRRLAEALERLPDRATPEGVALMLELAVDGMFRRGLRLATRRWGARALDAARPLGDMPLIATAGAIVILGGACSGEIAEAESLLAEVVALVDGMSDEELARRPDAAGYLGGRRAPARPLRRRDRSRRARPGGRARDRTDGADGRADPRHRAIHARPLGRVGRGTRRRARDRAHRRNRAGDRVVARESVDVGARRRGCRDGAVDRGGGGSS